VVDVWSNCTERVADEMMKDVAERARAHINSVYMMAHSGARGSAAQIKQLAGMRGLMAKPSGEIIETPIISNFKEGLTVLEYFNSTHGARKGLADTRLKTANSGYLTRRLVDVARDAIITEDDCAGRRPPHPHAVVEGGEAIVDRWPSASSAAPRFDDIIDPLTSARSCASRRDASTRPRPTAIEKAGIDLVRIRSVLTCETKIGVCGKCYGRDPRPRHAGQHRRGDRRDRARSRSASRHPAHDADLPHRRRRPARRRAEHRSKPCSTDDRIANRNVGQEQRRQAQSVMSRNLELVLEGRDQPRAGAPPRPARRQAVRRRRQRRCHAGQRIAEWDPLHIADHDRARGTIEYLDLIEGTSMREVTDEATGISSKVVVDWRQQARGADLRPRIQIKGANNRVLTLPNGAEARYFLSVDAISLGRERSGREGRRRARAHPARNDEDARHHRRSAAGGRAVRGAAAQGPRDHRRDAAAWSSARTTRPSAVIVVRPEEAATPRSI
jgi:DNA-directed RNA polymerase subunit beta'